MTNGNGGRAERLEAVLRAEFAPSQLDVIDERARCMPAIPARGLAGRRIIR